MRRLTVCAVILALFSASAEYPPIRPAFEPGRVGGFEPLALRPQSSTVGAQLPRRSESTEAEKMRRDVERAQSALAGAHGQARRNLEKVTVRDLSVKTGIDKAVSEGAVKQVDAVSLRRNLERAVEDLHKTAERMGTQRLEGRR